MSNPPNNSPSEPSRDPEELAPYAVHDDASVGRLHPESDTLNESPFDFDRRRILNSAAFRRLMHKTQVFVADQGDHFRTRLTHTLEVASQARRLARLLRLNARLAGAIALAHDLGHPPFGHAGETGLAKRMAGHGGFEHNLQSLRVVDYLEHPYPAFRGLNLSFEVRESLLKHTSRYDRPDGDQALDAQTQPLADIGPNMPLEGQIVNLADAIAYTLHDIEDGLGEGVLTEDALNASRLWRDSATPIRSADPKLSLHAVRRPILDDIATRLCNNAVTTSNQKLRQAGITRVEEVRQAGNCLITFSDETQAGVEELQQLLFDSMYRNHRIVRMDSKAKRLIGGLFDAYIEEPALLPDRFRCRIPEQELHRVVCDYVAGMTDRFCQQEHLHLYAPFHFG